MTELEVSEAAINAHLDWHPEDQESRAVLADLLRDLGRDDEADGLLWLVTNGKYPRDLGGMIPSVRWAWNSAFDEDKHYNLPRSFYGGEDALFSYHATRAEAESDAIRLARREGLIKKGGEG